jgi:hypothetical protein
MNMGIHGRTLLILMLASLNLPYKGLEPLVTLLVACCNGFGAQGGKTH